MSCSPRLVSMVACVVPQPASTSAARIARIRVMPDSLPIPRRRFPSGAVLALEALAVARELALELLAAGLRRVHAPRLVLIEGQRGVHARDVVAPEGVGQLLGAVTVLAQDLERRAA